MRRIGIAGRPMTVQVDIYKIYNAPFVRREALLGCRPRTREEVRRMLLDQEGQRLGEASGGGPVRR